MMTPPRLHKKEEKKPLIPKEYLLQFIIVLAFILFVFLLVWICFMIVPPTHGFYWW